MKYDFKKVAVLPNVLKDKELVYTKELLSVLGNKYEIFLQKDFSELAEKYPVKCVNDDEFFSLPDVIIVLGGDGSILRASDRAAYYEIPIIGINLGRLGYIAELEPSDISKICEIMSGEFDCEKRTMLEAEVIRNGESIVSGVLALNDAAVVRASGLGVVETELFCNGKPVYKYRGDGIILSTATGSSAYSMSAGGPVMDTKLDCISVTPICAHSLRCRPIVFSGDSVFEIVCRATPDRAKLTLDGESSLDLMDADIVKVKKSGYVTRLLRSPKSDFCSILYRKMSDV